MGIPIVNRHREIVGWTDVPPEIAANTLRHRDAERLLRGPVFCVEITITDPADIARAGAPRGWRSLWRCIALCCDEPIATEPQLRRFLASAPAAQTEAPPARRRRRSTLAREARNADGI